MGGNFHLKLNIDSRPIANKYREGKVKRTLKRELKAPEIAGREATGTSYMSHAFLWSAVKVRWWSASVLLGLDRRAHGCCAW